MKTNHQRGFVEKVTAYVGQGRNGGGMDATRGKHGIAKNNRGMKKFFNSRARFRVHSLEREVLKVDPEEICISTSSRGRRIWSGPVDENGPVV